MLYIHTKDNSFLPAIRSTSNRRYATKTSKKKISRRAESKISNTFNRNDNDYLQIDSPLNYLKKYAKEHGFNFSLLNNLPSKDSTESKIKKEIGLSKRIGYQNPNLLCIFNKIKFNSKYLNKSPSRRPIYIDFSSQINL